MKRLSILGSTGSIGVSTLRVVDAHPDSFRVVALAAGRNVDLMERQVRRYRPLLAAMGDPKSAKEASRRFGSVCRVAVGPEGLTEIATHPEADLVVCGLVGAVGLAPTYAAVDAGKPVALANKEALVVGGAHLTRRASETGVPILPVDSEHNALHQCLRGESLSEVKYLWLTASGGPFRGYTREQLARVTVREALAHPTWRMGPKITVDSATLMNKGLEVIEARWLFGVEPDRIRVVVHPKSVVHSMVEFVDGSFKAQLGVTDMRHPIQYALTWPDRRRSDLPSLDLVAAGPLEFEHPDPKRFPCLTLAYRALEAGGAAPAVLNAANEVAVQAFLEHRIAFLDIPGVIETVLDRHGGEPVRTLEDLHEADRRAREAAARALEGVGN